MRKFEACARVSLSLLIAALSGCTVGAAAGVPDQPAPADPSGSGTASESVNAVTPPETWTIFVYANADNGRSPALAADLSRMSQAHLGPNVKVIVLADWDTSIAAPDGHPIFPSGTEWYTLNGDGKSPTITSRDAEKDLDDPAVLRASVERAFRENPARHHGLVIWSRGGGQFFGADTQDGSRPSAEGMSVSAMVSAIGNGLAAAGLAGDRPLDMLGFDSSRTPRIELAYAAKQLAQVYVSNAAIDGGSSWAYADTFAFLAAEPGATARALAAHEAEAWQKSIGSSPSGGALPRAHVAVDTSKLDGIGRATSSLVSAVSKDPEAMRRVARARYVAMSRTDGTGREPSYRDLVTAIADGPNLGVATSAAENAAAQLAAAMIGPAASDFAVAMPPASAILTGWVQSYATTAKAWDGASGWLELLASFATAGDGSAPAIEGAIGKDLDEAMIPGTASVNQTFIHVASDSHDLGFVRASLFQKSQAGSVLVAHGHIGARSFGGRSAMIPWTRHTASVAGQPASAMQWHSKVALRGRLDVAHKAVDAALVVLGETSRVFVLRPSDGGDAITAAEILTIDPAATFTPSLSRIALESDASPTTYGTPIAIMDTGLPLGSSELPAGTYEVEIEAEDVWGNGATVIRPYIVPAP
jgi:hypothetical protein